MTKAEFDAAVIALRDHFIIRHRRGLSEEIPWDGPTDAELTEFLSGLDRLRRRRLKKIAEGLSKDILAADLH
jgi:hypothetical protein